MYFFISSLTSVGTLTSLNITGNTINNGNLTISGTLQSPMTSLLTISSNIIDGKISSQLGITNTNLNNASILLGVSSGIIDNKLGQQLGITNTNLDNNIILLGVSSGIIDGKINHHKLEYLMLIMTIE